MRTSKRILTILLASLLASSTMLLSGCGNDQTPSDDSTTDAPIETTAETEPILPDIKFDNTEVMFLTEKHQSMDWYSSREIYAEGITGELINDTVFQRNDDIENRFSVKISQANLVNASDVATNSIIAGDKEFDVIMPYMNKTMPLAMQGLLLDLNTIPHLNLDQDWWDQRANADLTINGKLFFTTGDISILDNECTMVMFFNKDMITDFKLTNPYTAVKEGKWTLDLLSSMVQTVKDDVNGDSKMTQDDRWGLSVANLAPLSFYFGSGNRLADNDSDGKLSLQFSTKRSTDSMDKIFELCLGTDVISHSTTGQINYTQIVPVFSASRLLFATHALVDIMHYREVPFEFGILPYPKYDEQQEDYHSLISTGLIVSTSVPLDCTIPEAVGVTLEALAYYSKSTLTVAYYDNTLKLRSFRDQESGDMLDIIFASRVYDLGYIFNWGGIGNMVTNLYKQKNTAYASTYAGLESAAISEMQKTVDEFANIK